MKLREIPRPQNPSGLYSHQQISPTELPTRRNICIYKTETEKVLRLNTCLTSNMDVNASQPRILSGNIWVKGGLCLLSSSYFSGIWSLLFYLLEQTNKDIFAAVHQRKAELAEIVDWTGLYETGCFYLFRVPHLLMDKYLLGNTWVLWQWISWQYDQHQQLGWSANLLYFDTNENPFLTIEKLSDIIISVIRSRLYSKARWTWRGKKLITTYSWHRLFNWSWCNDFIHTCYLEISFVYHYLVHFTLYIISTSRSLSKFMWRPSSIASLMSCRINCSSLHVFSNRLSLLT